LVLLAGWVPMEGTVDSYLGLATVMVTARARVKVKA
jgi:hypothetical protein